MPFENSDSNAAADERAGAGGATGESPDETAESSPDRAVDQMRRLHPYTLGQRFLISAPALFVVILPSIRNPDAGAWVSIGSLVLYGVFVVPLFIAQYLRFRYAVAEDEIVIHKGVFTYQHRNIPIERIQNIEIEQSLVPRLFGTARVKIETAGSQSTEGVIEYVSLEEAHRIRKTVRARQRRAVAIGRKTDAREGPEPQHREGAARTPSTDRPAGTHDAGELDHAAAAHDEDDQSAGDVIHRMSLGHVLLSGVFRFSLFYIVAIFSATEYLGVTPEEIARWLSGDRFEVVAAAFESAAWLVVVSTLLMVTVLAWLTGIATNLNRFYGFQLAVDEDKLHTRTGLLTLSEGTIPMKKVQALLVRTNPLMSLFGWYRLELQTIGFDPDDRGYRVAVPFARWREVMEVARTIRPVEEPDDLHSVSPIMIRRTFVRYAVSLSILSGGIGYFWEPALWGFAALPLAAGLAYQQFKHHGYRLSDDYLYVRRGVFRETYWIIPVDRFQVFYLTQSLFQRRLGVQTAYVDSPGAGVMMHPEVVDLAREDASSLLSDLHRQFHKRFNRPG